MLCVATGVTSISVDGVEYEVEDALVEIPDADYKKIIHHRGIRAATREEIAVLENIAAAKKEKEKTGDDKKPEEGAANGNK